MASLNAYRYITTPKIILRPIEVADAPAIFQYTSDPRVARFTHWNAHTNLDDTIRYISHIQQSTNTHVWGIVLPQSNTLIGECSITQHENGRAELYYALAHAHWGNGYTTQALTALLSITDEIPAIERLEAWIIRENAASCRVAQKAGLHLERTIDKAWMLDDTAHDIALYISDNPI
jgi:[ribosomal protein S5]-alanine N-acetyltransferase